LRPLGGRLGSAVLQLSRAKVGQGVETGCRDVAPPARRALRRPGPRPGRYPRELVERARRRRRQPAVARTRGHRAAAHRGLALHARRVKEANTVRRRLALMQKSSQPTSGRGADLAGNPFPMVGHPFTQRILSRSRDLFLKVEL